MQIIKVPGVNGCPGCRNSGNLILTELEQVITSKGRSINLKEINLEEIHVDNNDLKEQQELISRNSLEAYETQDRIIFLGGDHSISFPAISSFFKFYSKNDTPFVIIFDSLPDIKNSQAIPDRRSWLSSLIKEFGADNLLLVGARTLEKEDKQFFDETKLRIINVGQFTSDLQDTTDFIMEMSHGRPTYVSLDISAIDPLYAPATKDKEDSGLTSQQVLYILKRIGMMKNLKALDIVELDASQDQKEVKKTAKLAARILAEVLS